MKRLWVGFFLLVFPLMVVWAVTNPMFASPDEPAHMVRAQGIVRGQFDGPYKVDGIPVDDIKCLAFHPEVSADCMTLEWAEAPTFEDSTATNYPPLFHFLAGLPSLFVHGLTGAYVMRLWLALICSSLLALAGAILFVRYPSRFMFLGWALSVTPMVLFLSATVNPSGLAVALGAVIWASGMVLADPGTETDKRRLKQVLAVSAAAFLLVRRDSLLWLGAIGVSLVALNPAALLAFRGRSKAAVGGVVAAVSTGLLWVVPTWSVLSAGNNGRSRWASIPNDTYAYVKQAVGWFGWLDTPLSDAVMAAALVILGSFLLLGLSAATAGIMRALLAVGTLVFLIPLVFAEFRYPYFQGRYYLPLAIGGFFLAGRSLTLAALPKWIEHRLVGVLGILWAVVQVWAVVINVRRY
ncbi:MAG: DUF2142 domain-containing protein [Acidimicrobiales bacterium]|nr:DUF2142 domain-containing protein [Acidimicrobiales bacterium]